MTDRITAKNFDAPATQGDDIYHSGCLLVELRDQGEKTNELLELVVGLLQLQDDLRRADKLADEWAERPPSMGNDNWRDGRSIAQQQAERPPTKPAPIGRLTQSYVDEIRAESRLETLLEIGRRLFRPSTPSIWVMDGILEAPCLWCGYNGELYFQSGSHARDCRWYYLGGRMERIDAIRQEASRLPPEAEGREL